MKEIPNISQSRLKALRKLTQKKYREEEQRFIIEGVRLTIEALISDWEVVLLAATKDFLLKKEMNEILHLARQKDVEVCRISDEELARVSDTVTSQGIIGCVVAQKPSSETFWSRLPERTLIVMLENLSDPGNVGTILRTCDWFGVDAVFLQNNSVEIFNSKVVRASMGAIFHLPIFADESLKKVMNAANAHGVKLLATTLEGGRPFEPKNIPPKTIFVFGNEAHGLSSDVISHADQLITIPKFGRAESLNVAIACGVVLGTARILGKK